MSRKNLRTILGDQVRRSGLGRLRCQKREHHHRLRPALLELESRRLLANLTVSNTNGSGPGSLAAAIATANKNNQANTITFSLPASSTPPTIGLNAELTDTAGTQTITGPPGGITISGGGGSRVFKIDGGVTATLSGLTITGGTVAYLEGGDQGGGLANYGTAILVDCTITGNSTMAGSEDSDTVGYANGGGVFNQGNATLIDCLVSDNSTYAGGWSTRYNFGYGGGDGGGLYNIGSATLTDCTITGNSAGSGGGLYNGVGATLNLTACTVSANYATGHGQFSNSYNIRSATLTDCTITGNSAAIGGGPDNGDRATLNLIARTATAINLHGAGGLSNYYGSATLTDTIIAGNTNFSGTDDIGGSSTVSGTYNLIGTGGAGGLTNGTDHNIVLKSLSDLGLAPLGSYGGPTQTMALLPGTAAVGKGSASVSGVAIPNTDEAGCRCRAQSNIGAFQTGYGLVVNATTDYESAPTGELTLRNAVNLVGIVAGSPHITFDKSVFAAPQTITLLQGPLVFSGAPEQTTITGPALGVTISGGGQSGVIEVDSGFHLTVSDLSISDGSVSSGAGAGLNNDGTTMMTDCTITGSSAARQRGGGVYNGGTGALTLTDCTISHNSATYGGGGLANEGGAKVTLIDCTISDNSAGTDGGGVYNKASTLNLTDCTISGNPAGANGGGVYSKTGTLNLTDCTISGNSAATLGAACTVVATRPWSPAPSAPIRRPDWPAASSAPVPRASPTRSSRTIRSRAAPSRSMLPASSPAAIT